ncbi:hypothetical protein [Fodinibius sp. Rm-B-1B1-1]|uniref:hypothetical protein n=1 Tax=Fodinibius alkaliphilus TaxID=3140241 RepID=UPI003159A835
MSSFKTILAIGIIILTGIGWYLFSSTNSNSDPQASSQSIVNIDSLEISERPVITTQPKADTVDSIAPQVREELAPGTVLLRGKVVHTADEQNPNQKITITVQEVLGYGASASPVGTGETLDVNVQKEWRNDQEFKALIVKGEVVAMVLSSEGDMNFGEKESRKSWTLIELKPNK